MKVGIISYFFPPNNSSGAQRWSKLAEYLKNNGVDVFVISSAGDKFGGEDYERFEFLKKVIRIYSLPYSQPYRFPIHGKLNLLKLFIIPDSRVLFFIKYYRKISAILEGEMPDVVIISVPPFSSVLTVRALLKLKIPYVVDLRDVWLYDPRRPNKLADFIIERWVLKNAKGVFCINDYSLKEAKRFNKNAFLIPHFYNPKDYEIEPFNHSDIWISHIGSLFNERDINPLIKAVKNMGLTLRLVGPGSERFGGLGPVKRYRAIKEMVSADVLVAVFGDGKSQRYVSSVKLFEYIGAKKPIIVISPKGYIKRVAEGLGLGICENSEDDIKRCVKEALKGKYKPKNFGEYSIERIGNKVLNLLQMICKT